MIDHRQISDKRREIERDRREKVRELMVDYDKKHHAKLRELCAACGQIGHIWLASPHASDDFKQCTVCGASEKRT
ncbi:hypothetical protein [Ideonella sp.]|uniref:hypothetical protein n=1 Tax=Ideonella sp. TaxID=1929293 RepID=UPI003BB57BE8